MFSEINQVTKLSNLSYSGCKEKPVIIDAEWQDDYKKIPTVIFCHGYKGYKDWGAWNLISKKFADNGFLFVKFNFSHNGGTAEQPIDFPDLEAFSDNNYSLELCDVTKVIDWLSECDQLPHHLLDKERIFILGHSRGGAISVLSAYQDERIKALSTWAAVSDFEVRFPFGENLLKWRQEGVMHVRNGRTNQDMPHKFQFYEDFMNNQEKLDIRAAAKGLKVPYHIFHGVEDEAVHFSEAMRLNKWSRNSELSLLDNTGHTFGINHPWEKDVLTPEMEKVTDKTIDFFRRIS